MSELKLKFYHVGDGDCLLIYLPDGTLGLVDSHVPGWMDDCPALVDILAHERRELSFVCLTHPHADHYGGLKKILTDGRLTIAEFWHTIDDVQNFLMAMNTIQVPDIDDPWAELSEQYFVDQKKELIEVYEAALDLKEKKQTKWRRMNEMKDLRAFAGCQFKSLSPSDNDIDRYVKKLGNQKRKAIDQATVNNLSSVLLLRYAGVSILLGADATSTGWKQILNVAKQNAFEGELKSQVLKVSHHGAKDEHLERLLIAIHKEGESYAIISAGSRTHPHRECIKVLKESGRRIFTTGLGGPSFVRSSATRAGLNDDIMTFLDEFSSDANDPQAYCCGTIEVTISVTGTVSVKTEHLPRCPDCG